MLNESGLHQRSGYSLPYNLIPISKISVAFPITFIDLGCVKKSKAPFASGLCPFFRASDENFSADDSETHIQFHLGHGKHCFRDLIYQCLWEWKNQATVVLLFSAIGAAPPVPMHQRKCGHCVQIGPRQAKRAFVQRSFCVGVPRNQKASALTFIRTTSIPSRRGGTLDRGCVAVLSTPYWSLIEI